LLPKLSLDAYEVRARFGVAVIVGLPVAVPVLALVPPDWPIRLGLGAVSLFVLYGFGFCVAGLGRVTQGRLWRKWGGPPSTRFCRWADSTWDKSLKERLHGAVKWAFGVEVFDRRRERENPTGADKAIDHAFGRVKSYLRKHDPAGLWACHNAEYGFARNLCGSATLGAVFAALAGAVCFTFWHLRDDQLALALAVVEAVLLTAFVALRFAMPTVVKQTAERYAESAWHAFLDSADRPEPVADPDRSGSTSTPSDPTPCQED
jgi:hypothetical protein